MNSRTSSAKGPLESEALLASAAAHLNRGNPAEARRCYEQLLAKQPRNPLALNGLGNLAVAGRNFAAATDLHQRAVKAQPRDPGLLNDLANALILARDAEAALPHLRKALELMPGLLAAELNMVRALRGVGRLDEAIRRLDSLERGGHAPRVDLTLERAITLAEAGDSRAAVPLFRQVLDQRPEDARAIDGLITAHRATAADNDVARLEAALARPTLPRLARTVAERGLGKILEDLGRFDDAFAHYSAANSLSRATFDIAAHEASIRELIESFTPALLAEHTRSGDVTEQPVFVVGLPRSGTTLIEQILASHPAVVGLGELSDIEQGLREVFGLGWGDPGVVSRLGRARRDDVRQAARRYRQMLGRRAAGRERAVDKMPHNFLVLGWIAIMFPRARVIHVRRNPLDVCASLLTQHFSEAHAYSNDQLLLARYHASYERLMRHWQGLLGDRLADVAYEDVVSDLEGRSRAMIAHVGLTWDPRCLAFHETRRIIDTPSRWQVRQPLYNSSIGRWRRFERHLGPLRAALDAAAGKSSL